MADELIRPKPTNVACTVRPARRQHASSPNSATTSDSPMMCKPLSSSKNARSESSQCFPITAAARAMMTTWKNVSPIRKRCRARHTPSGRDPPEGTRDHRRLIAVIAVGRRRRVVMGRQESKGDARACEIEESRGCLPSAVAMDPTANHFLPKTWHEPVRLPSRGRFPENGASCAVYQPEGGPHARRHLHRGRRRPCHGLSAPVLPEVPAGTVPPPYRLLSRRPVGQTPGAERRHGARSRYAAGDAGGPGPRRDRSRVSLSHVRASDR